MDSICLAVVLTASDVRMRENYVTMGIPETSYICTSVAVLAYQRLAYQIPSKKAGIRRNEKGGI